jgi:hypothetical protein
MELRSSGVAGVQELEEFRSCRMRQPFSAAKNPAALRVDSKDTSFSPRRQKLLNSCNS